MKTRNRKKKRNSNFILSLATDKIIMENYTYQYLRKEVILVIKVKIYLRIIIPLLFITLFTCYFTITFL